MGRKALTLDIGPIFRYTLRGAIPVKEQEVKKVLVAVGVFLALTGTVSALARPKKSLKAIYINLATQSLRCYQGDEVVYSSRISSGRSWGASGSGKKNEYRKDYKVLLKDPAGKKAVSKVEEVKLVKGKRVVSFKTVSTPWKLVLSWDHGHYVRIHGYKSVPRTPRSHGCFRLPLKRAKKVFDFAEVGMSVYVRSGKSTARAHRHRSARKHSRKQSVTDQGYEGKVAADADRTPRGVRRRHSSAPGRHPDRPAVGSEAG